MRRLLVLWVLGFLLGAVAMAAAQDSPLTIQSQTLSADVDVYGVPVVNVRGTLRNEDVVAFTDVVLTATGYNTAGEAVAEGFGYLVNACHAALPAEFTLEPGAEQGYIIPLELYEDDVTVDRVNISAEGTQTIAALATDAPVLPAGITAVAGGDVVNVEWIDGENLRFAEGCYRDLFTQQTWREYNLLAAQTTPLVEHPQEARVTEALRAALGLSDPLYFQHSAISFDPTGGRRLVYQTELSTVVTAEQDGAFKRIVFDRLSSYSLEGIHWLRDGRFLAYYYGATGDPVLYFTASADGQSLSESVPKSLPSRIIPGASPDGERLVIALDDGYYLKRAAYAGTERLFEHTPPDNNWPAPAWAVTEEGADQIYVALPADDGSARLACYDSASQTLTDLTALPLNLTTEDRARWWLSPDDRYLALVANGLNGGLWTIDLNALGGCAGTKS